MNTRKTGASITVKISAVSLAAVIISAMCIGIFSHFLYRRDSIESNAQQALIIAQSIAIAIDGERFMNIIDSREKNDYWHEVKAILDEVRANTKAKYLYVLDRDYDTEVIYFAEGNLPEDDDAIDFLETEPADVHADELFATLASGQNSTTDIYDAGEFGTMVSGFSPIFNDKGEVVGVVGVDYSIDDVLSSSRAFGFLIITIAVASCLIFGLLVMLYTAKFIGKPVKALSEVSKKIACGDMAIQLNIRSRDEIGQLATDFQAMAESTKRQVELMETLADGDLTAEIIPRSGKDSMSIATKKMLGDLNDMLSHISISAGQVSSVSTQISNGALSLSENSQEQANDIEKLLGQIADVTVQTEDNARRSDRAAELAGIIRLKAEKGSAQMERMIRSVNEISEASRSISKVMKVIDDIAFQTNILALNAAVEAARAGQYGKGFAVVAEEVRNLAGKSAEAAKETGSLIEDSIRKAAAGAQIADETAASLSEIVSGINESNEIISEISVSSRRQSAAVVDIHANVDHFAQTVQAASASAEENAAASHEMSTQADLLFQVISQFKTKDGNRLLTTGPAAGTLAAR